MRARSGLAALVFVVVVGGCASNKHESIVFEPTAEGRFSKRGPAAISDRSSEALVADGYVQIGMVSVVRVVSICYESCERVEHEQTCTGTLLEVAGRRGGDLVVLERDEQSFTEPVHKRGGCIESYVHDQGAGPRGHGVVTGPLAASVCTQFEALHGHETFVVSSGTVWRAD